MNFRKVLMIALSPLLVLSATLCAQPQKQKTAASVQQGPAVKLPPNRALNIKTDLEVKIEAFEDQAGKYPITNNGSVSYGGGAPSGWVRFSIRNKGALKAENFTYKMVIRVNGYKFYDPPAASLTLAPGQTKVFPMAQVPYPGTTNEVTAKIIADIGNFIAEYNEQNNSASFNYTATVAH